MLADGTFKGSGYGYNVKEEVLVEHTKGKDIEWLIFVGRYWNVLVNMVSRNYFTPGRHQAIS